MVTTKYLYAVQLMMISAAFALVGVSTTQASVIWDFTSEPLQPGDPVTGFIELDTSSPSYVPGGVITPSDWLFVEPLTGAVFTPEDVLGGGGFSLEFGATTDPDDLAGIGFPTRDTTAPAGGNVDLFLSGNMNGSLFVITDNEYEQGTFTVRETLVPEPGTAVLAGLMGIGLLSARRRVPLAASSSRTSC